MNRQRQFSLLVVRDDGTRVLRLRLPGWLPVVAAVAAGVALVVLVAGISDWWHRRHLAASAGALYQQARERQAALDRVQRRMAELRHEISGWRELQARMWEVFGPDPGARGREAGIGGRVTPAEPVPPLTGEADELSRLEEMVREQGESLRALDRVVGRARKTLAALPSRWPLRGSVNSEFGRRQSPWTHSPEFHGGIDIAATPGTPVRAPAPGTVIHAGWHAEYGQTVILAHGAELRTLYGHLSRVLVQAGQNVERGATLGLSGNTGRSSGPHLHYEILVQNRPVNPRAFLWD